MASPTSSHRDEGFLCHITCAVGGCLLDRMAIWTGFGDGLRLLGVFLLAPTRQHLQRRDHDLCLPMANGIVSSNPTVAEPEGHDTNRWAVTRPMPLTSTSRDSKR
jgi:hypothetical protein